MRSSPRRPVSTPEDRHRHLSDGLTPLTCEVCGTVVRVRKSSPVQTSIQWVTPTQSCPSLTEQVRAGAPAGCLETCAALRRTIAGAVKRGELRVNELDE